MKILKTSLNILISFLLIILIASNMVINVLENKILNKEYMLSKIEETEMYTQVSREVNSGFENYIYQSGLPEDIIKDLYTEEILKSDINSFVDALYDGTEVKISDDIIRETLDNRINEFLTSENKILNNQGKKNIEKFEDLIVQEYKNNINAYESVYKEGNKVIEKTENIIDKIKIFPIILIVILCVALIVINLKDLLQVINYVCISFLSLGILIKIGVNIIFSKINIDNIILITKSLSNLLINITKEILYSFSDTSTFFIVIGLSGIIIFAIFSNIKKDNSDNNSKPRRRVKK